MESNRRRFVRVRSEEAGLLEFVPRPAKGGMREARRMVPVTISSVACEGMRVQTTEPLDLLHTRSRIDIRLMLYGEELDLPGRVVWRSSGAGGATTLGVSLLLPLAPARARQMWATWIVAATERHLGAVRARGSGEHRISYVSRSAIRRAKSEGKAS